MELVITAGAAQGVQNGASTAVLNKSFSALVGSALILMLSACASTFSGPDYEVPTLASPERFHQQIVDTRATNALADVTDTNNEAPLDSWWNAFHDPELSRLIARVQSHNIDLDIAMARVQQARAAANLTDAAMLPSGTVGLQAASQRQSLQSPLGLLAQHTPGYQRDMTLYDSAIGAGWELDLSGGLHRAHEASVADAQSIEAERLAVLVMVQADTADAYFQVRGAQARIALALAEMNDDARLLEVVNLRLNEGLATRQEQAEAEARLYQVRASVPQLRHEVDLQSNRLDVLMGDFPGTFAVELNALTAESGDELTTPALAAKLQPKDLLSHRPDVIAAERRLAASSARIGVASSEYYPKLSLSALLGFEGLNSAAWSAASFQPQALIGLHWRLFDFGRVDAEVAQARGAHAEALARYRSAMLKATEEVENALSLQAQYSAERHELLNEVAADQRARVASEQAYQGGVTGIAELLEQDRQLLAARDQLLIVDTGTARATVATYRALGGGWK